METRRRLIELANSIHVQTTKIDQYLAAKSLNVDLMDVDMEPVMRLPDDLISCRDIVIDAADELKDLMLGPMQCITSITSSLQTTIHALYRFDIANSFPIGSTTTFHQISVHIGLPIETTRHLIRAAITHRIFREPSPNEVTHTALSALIARTPSLRQYMGLVAEESWRGASHLIDALEKWPDSEDSKDTGYNIVTGISVPYFEGMAMDSERQRRFDETMSFLHSNSGFERALLLDQYNWPEHGMIVDVGGSQALMCIDLARRFPEIRTINQDLPEVIKGISPLPKELKDRIELMEHDFFKMQPVHGADVYLFRWIFHDWADGNAIKILRALIPALKDGARIVISDACLPEAGTIPLYAERRLRGFDLNMKAVLNAKERHEDEWAALIAEIDPRLKFCGVQRHPKSRLALMEARWETSHECSQSSNS